MEMVVGEIVVSGDIFGEVNDIIKLENINLQEGDVLNIDYQWIDPSIFSEYQFYLFDTNSNEIVWRHNVGILAGNILTLDNFMARGGYSSLFLVIPETNRSFYPAFDYRVTLTKGSLENEQELGQNVLLDFDGELLENIPSSFWDDVDYIAEVPAYSTEWVNYDWSRSREEQISEIRRRMREYFAGYNINFYVEDSISGMSDLPPDVEEYTTVLLTSFGEGFIMGLSMKIDGVSNPDRADYALVFQGSMMGWSDVDPLFEEIMHYISGTTTHEIGHLIGLDHTENYGDDDKLSIMTITESFFDRIGRGDDYSFNRAELDMWMGFVQGEIPVDKAYQNAPMQLGLYSLGFVPDYCTDYDDIDYPPGQSPPGTTRTRSSGGVEGKTFSTVTGVFKYDTCEDDQFILESYCGLDGENKHVRISCGGSRICVDSGSNTLGDFCTLKDTCEDSDDIHFETPNEGHPSLLREGYVKYWYQPTGITTFYYDECVSDNEVREYYCSDLDGLNYSVVLPCSDGKICNNGKCENPPGNCIDECSSGDMGCEGELYRWTCKNSNDGDACLDRVYSLCGSGTECKLITRGKPPVCLGSDWGSAAVSKGEQVSLEFGPCDESDCLGQSVSFKVYDSLFGTEADVSPADAVVGNDGYARTTWTVELHYTEIPTTYKFDANIEGEIVPSGELLVSGDGSVCGNSIVESGEQCDDGNLIDGDGCSSSCIFEFSEACQGNMDNGDGMCMVRIEVDTNDVYLSVTNVDGDWEAARSASVATGVGNLETMLVGNKHTPGGPSHIHRSNLPFDTSVIPDEAEIVSGNIVLWRSNIIATPEEGYYVSVVESNFEQEPFYSSADFNNFGNIEGSNRLFIGNLIQEGKAEIELNSVGLGWIDKLGWSGFGLKGRYDLEGHPGNVGFDSSFWFRSSADSDLSKRPVLEVVFRISECGDGIVDSGEQCDDGNLINGDGCS